jgi:hypothetical protein
MSVRRVTDETLASRTAASQPHHRSAGGGLINKYQPCGIKQALLSYPTPARANHVGALLLLRVQSLFLKAETVPFVEMPHRSAAAGNLFPGHRSNDVFQCQIRLFFNQTQQKRGVTFHRWVSPR